MQSPIQNVLYVYTDDKINMQYSDDDKIKLQQKLRTHQLKEDHIIL
jgi:hypothetical protein